MRAWAVHAQPCLRLRCKVSRPSACGQKDTGDRQSTLPCQSLRGHPMRANTCGALRPPQQAPVLPVSAPADISWIPFSLSEPSGFPERHHEHVIIAPHSCDSREAAWRGMNPCCFIPRTNILKASFINIAARPTQPGKLGRGRSSPGDTKLLQDEGVIRLVVSDFSSSLPLSLSSPPLSLLLSPAPFHCAPTNPTCNSQVTMRDMAS